jgi:AcrR family transcriptional regulator
MVLIHPTKEALINIVLELLKTESLNEINSDEVLHKSGISKGSMYHHFEDFADLLEQAQVRRYGAFVDQSIIAIAQLLVIKDFDAFKIGLRGVTQINQSPDLKQQRLQRVKAIAEAEMSPRMQKYMAVEQERLNLALTDLFREIGHRGWANPKLQPQTLSVFLQAYTMGQIVNDYADTKMEIENWCLLLDTIMEEIILKAN